MRMRVRTLECRTIEASAEVLVSGRRVPRRLATNGSCPARSNDTCTETVDVGGLARMRYVPPISLNGETYITFSISASPSVSNSRK